MQQTLLNVVQLGRADGGVRGRQVLEGGGDALQVVQLAVQRLHQVRLGVVVELGDDLVRLALEVGGSLQQGVDVLADDGG